MVLRNFPHELEVSEACIRPLAATGMWRPRRGCRSIASAELYLAGFRVSPDLLPGNGVILDCFFSSGLGCKLTIILVVVRVLCPGPFPGRLGWALVVDVARFLEGEDRRSLPEGSGLRISKVRILTVNVSICNSFTAPSQKDQGQIIPKVRI